ncbi:MAG: protein NnrT [Jannaschia sp.]
MRFLPAFLTAFLPGLALAEAFDRPIPQPQSATAEIWFAAASVALLVALLAVHLSVRRR